MNTAKLLRVPHGEFIRLVEEKGAQGTADFLGINIRNVHRRRSYLEGFLKRPIRGPDPRSLQMGSVEDAPGRLDLKVDNGIVVVAGDAHYWPGPPTLMHRALARFLKQFREERKLKAFIMNGDATDLASISRWPQVNWEKRPSVQEEIEVCIERMHELAEASGKAPKYWPLGNHDARWSIYLAQHAEKFAGVQGMHLKDSFPLYEACWSVMINKNVQVKHFFKSGRFASSNNPLHAGVHVITNHLHSPKVTPYTNLKGDLYGVDTGMIAEPFGRQFLYLQDNQRDWRPGFAVLTFVDGKLMYPELVVKWNEKQVQFRGEIITP